MCFCKCLFADTHFLPVHVMNIFTFLEEDMQSLQISLCKKQRVHEKGRRTKMLRKKARYSFFTLIAIL